MAVLFGSFTKANQVNYGLVEAPTACIDSPESLLKEYINFAKLVLQKGGHNAPHQVMLAGSLELNEISARRRLRLRLLDAFCFFDNNQTSPK